MHTILVAGAGKSSSFLIHYLLTNAKRNKWKIIVADGDAKAISEKLNGNENGEIAVIDITKESDREPLVKRADIVISLMPAHLHILLAKDCLKHKKNLITSSYISDEMKEMDKDVKEAGLMFMCEMGLDPGIDHMSANALIHSIHKVSGVITSFKSMCGGLIAPESDNNPWHYKFTWNPRNVVTAGVDGATYLNKGKITEVPYDRIFEHNKRLQIDGAGALAWYPNRDSLRYLDLYEVPEIKTFIRATFRHPDFCQGWQALLLMGLTSQDDFFETKGHTYASWIKMKTGYHNSVALSRHIADTLLIDENTKLMGMLQWLGLFDEKPLQPGRYSSADVLLSLLLEKWSMAPEDKDMVVMQHEIEYERRGALVKVSSTMIIKGDDREHSAMAKTVGLPMAVLAKLVLTNRIKPPVGVLLPNMVSVYRPIMVEMAHHGIVFNEVVE
jgi:saccharopine dehydrogenase-like NADP-dependent oxidoreductase